MIRKLSPLARRYSLGWIAWFVALLFLAAMARSVLPYQPSFPYASDLLEPSRLPQWWYSWANFDGVHYLTIVEHGYVGTGLIQAFFPGWPLVIKAVSGISPYSPLATALAMATITAMLLAVAWWQWVNQEHTRHRTFMLAVFWLFPTALFFHAAYSESLFLSLALFSFLSATAKFGLHVQKVKRVMKFPL